MHIFRILFSIFKGKLNYSASNFNFKVILAIVAIICFSTSGFMYFEIGESPDLDWGDAFWWSFVTMTTVGYGDYYPATAGGRIIIGIPTMIFGISILGFLLSNIASYLIETRSKELKGMKQIKETNHILIIHFPSLNKLEGLISELRADSKITGKAIVLIDDVIEELPMELDKLGVLFVRGNPARRQTLEQANIKDASHAIILSKNPMDVRSDDLTLAVNLAIESVNSHVISIAECVDPESIESIRRTGSDSVVCVSRLSGNLLVQELLDPGAQEIVEELTDVKGEQIFVQNIENMNDWLFSELREWMTEQRLLLIGVKQLEQGNLLLNPENNLKLQKGDKAVFIGTERPEIVATS